MQQFLKEHFLKFLRICVIHMLYMIIKELSYNYNLGHQVEGRDGTGGGAGGGDVQTTFSKPSKE